MEKEDKTFQTKKMKEIQCAVVENNDDEDEPKIEAKNQKITEKL